jgi:hypothetical protein
VFLRSQENRAYNRYGHGQVLIVQKGSYNMKRTCP